MIRAEDVKSIKEKPYNSILPYLRAKATEKAKFSKDKTIPNKDKEAKYETYQDAIHNIVSEK